MKGRKKNEHCSLLGALGDPLRDRSSHCFGPSQCGDLHGNVSGEIMAFFVMVVAAAEVVVGLAIVVSIFKSRVTTNVDDLDLLKN